MAGPFEGVYSDEQRSAVAEAYEDRGIRPARKVVELAARGELTYNGETLGPFDMPVLYVNELARNLRRKRLGQAKSGLAEQPPRDAVEALRRRLVSAADNMLADLERRQGKRTATQPKDPELLRQIARATREIAAIPGPNDPRSVQPGQKIPGGGGAKESERTSGGLAGTILNAHRTNSTHTPEDDPYQSLPLDTDQDGEHSAAQHHNEPPTEQDDNGPGAWMRAQVEDLPSRALGVGGADGVRAPAS